MTYTNYWLLDRQSWQTNDDRWGAIKINPVTSESIII